MIDGDVSWLQHIHIQVYQRRWAAMYNIRVRGYVQWWARTVYDYTTSF